MDGEFGGFWVTMIVAVSCITFFGAIAAIILGPIWLKERTKRSAHDLIAKALERGENIDPALMQKLTESIEVQQKSPRKTLGSAVVLLALSAAFIGSGLLDDGMLTSSDDGAFPGLILGVLGLAFLTLALVDYNSKKKEG